MHEKRTELYYVEVKDTIDRARYASCLSIRHENDSEGPLKHYDKSDDFNYDFVTKNREWTQVLQKGKLFPLH
jgi:hypothetical protein